MKSKQNTVSVVVPIFNVEPYLRKCLDSIICQTYSNLEIILVDDGSQDESLSICKKYAELDKRVTVIHQSNAGLSSARNTGINSAGGKYITFVDSDDYLEQDAIEFLHKQLVDNGCDMSTCLYRSFRDDQAPLADVLNDDNSAYTLSSEEALEDALYQKRSTLHAWAKLYKKVLFDDVRYPVGKLYEDAGTTYKLISKSKLISINTARKYHYLRRKSSITGAEFSPKMLDSIFFADQMHSYILKHYPPIIPASQHYLFSVATNMFDLIINSSTQYGVEKEFCKTIIKQYDKSIIKNKHANFKSKLYACCSVVSMWLLEGLMITKNKLKRRKLSRMIAKEQL